MNDSDGPVRVPLGARVIAVIDGLLAVAGMVCAIDVPLLGLVATGATLPAAWGLFRGTWWGLWMHVAMLGLGLLAYTLMAMGLLAAMDRPRGHMELWTPKGTLIVLSIVLVVYLLVCAAPVIYLLRNSVRSAWPGKQRLR
jgi:hypothetical protein